jgi:hypothetical protein
VDVTARDFRRHFEALSDEALLAVDTSELVESACACHDEEIARRGLKSSAVVEESETSATEDGDGSPKTPDEELVCVADYDYMDEAEIAQGLLEAASIPASLSSEQGLSMMNISGAANGVRLMVPKHLADQALSILATPLSDEELAAQAEAAGQIPEELEEELDEVEDRVDREGE